jgi:hypothetical protein
LCAASDEAVVGNELRNGVPDAVVGDRGEIACAGRALNRHVSGSFSVLVGNIVLSLAPTRLGIFWMSNRPGLGIRRSGDFGIG